VRILPGWSVEKARCMGASAVKLLVYYHPESAISAEIEDFIGRVAADCRKQDLLVMLEPLAYALNDKGSQTSDEKRAAVIGTARKLSPLGIDILKAEFPLGPTEADQEKWLQACQELSAASVVPWILLSAAVDFETYRQQVSVACQAGASGCAVGRAVWQEAVAMEVAERKKFLETTARERMVKLMELCDSKAKPYTDFYTATAPFDWYRTY